MSKAAGREAPARLSGDATHTENPFGMPHAALDPTGPNDPQKQQASEPRRHDSADHGRVSTRVCDSASPIRRLVVLSLTCVPYGISPVLPTCFKADGLVTASHRHPRAGNALQAQALRTVRMAPLAAPRNAGARTTSQTVLLPR